MIPSRRLSPPPPHTTAVMECPQSETRAEKKKEEEEEEEDEEVDFSYANMHSFPPTLHFSDSEWRELCLGHSAFSLYGHEGRLRQHLSVTSPLQWRTLRERRRMSMRSSTASPVDAVVPSSSPAPWATTPHTYVEEGVEREESVRPAPHSHGGPSSFFLEDSASCSSRSGSSGSSAKEEEEEETSGHTVRRHDTFPNDEDDAKRREEEKRRNEKAKRLSPMLLPLSNSWWCHHFAPPKKEDAEEAFFSSPPQEKKEEEGEEERMTKTFFYHFDHGAPHTRPPWVFSLKEEENCEFPYYLGWLKEVQVRQKKCKAEEKDEKKKEEEDEKEAAHHHPPKETNEEEKEEEKKTTAITVPEQHPQEEPPHSSPLTTCTKDQMDRPTHLPPMKEEHGMGMGTKSTFTPNVEGRGAAHETPPKTTITRIQKETEKKKKEEEKGGNGAGTPPRGEVRREKKRRNEDEKGEGEEEVFVAYVGGTPLGTLEEEVARGKRKLAALYRGGGTAEKPVG